MAVLEVAVDQKLNGSGRPVVNVFHVNTGDVPFTSVVAKSVGDIWTAQVTAHQHNQIVTERVRVRSLDSLSYGEEPYAVAGSNTDSGASAQVALLAKKVVPGLARRRHGRMFIAGLAEWDVGHDGSLQSATIDNWKLWLAGLINQLETAGHPMVQLDWTSWTQGQATATFFPVAELVPQPVVATQRRRVRG